MYRFLTFAGLILLTCAWLVPNHYPPWTSFHNESAAFAALTLLLLAWITRRRYFAVGYAWRLPLVLLPLLVVQLMVGKVTYLGDAWVSGLYLVGFCAAYWLGRQFAADARASTDALALFAGAVVVAAVCSVWLALHQWLGVERLIGFNAVQDLASGSRPFGNLGQPNHLATLLMMALPLAAILRVQRHIRPWQFMVIGALLTWGLAIAGSRASVVSAMLWVGFYAWKGMRYCGRKGLTSLLVWGAVLLVCMPLVEIINRHLLIVGGGRTLQGIASDKPRLTLWSQYLSAIQASPWTGYGWHQSVAAQKVGALRFPSDMPSDYAHSVVLDLMVWLGVPLSLVLLGMLVTYLWRLFSRVETLQNWLGLAATLPFLFHCLVEYPFAYAYFILPIAWLLGYTSQGTMDRVGLLSEPVVPRTQSQAAPIMIGVFAVALFWTWFEYLQAEDDYRVMRFEIRSVGKVPEGHSTPHLVLLTQLLGLLHYGRWEPRYQMSEAEIDALRQANRSIHWATLQTKFVVALAINGHVDEANEELQALEAIYGRPTRLYAQKVIATYKGQFPELKTLRVID